MNMPLTIATGRPWFRAGLFLGMTLAGLAFEGDSSGTRRKPMLFVPTALRAEPAKDTLLNVPQDNDRYAGLKRHLEESFEVVPVGSQSPWSAQALASNRVACLIADSSRIDVDKFREQWSDESVARLVHWVEEGGGLVILAGPRTEPAINRLLKRFGIVINPVSGDGKTWAVNDTTPVVGGRVWWTSRLGRLDVMETLEGIPPIIISNDKRIPGRTGGQDPVGMVAVLHHFARGRVVVVAAEDWVADDTPQVTGTELAENWRIVYRLLKWAGGNAK